jgi:hypothetical protein
MCISIHILRKEQYENTFKAIFAVCLFSARSCIIVNNANVGANITTSKNWHRCLFKPTLRFRLIQQTFVLGIIIGERKPPAREIYAIIYWVW